MPIVSGYLFFGFQIMTQKSESCKITPLSIRNSIIAVRVDRQSASRQKLSPYLNKTRVQQFNQVGHDNIDTILVKVPMISEAEQI